MTGAQPLLERYRELIARPGEAFPLTLGEGGTPLIHARRLGEALGLDNLHLKFEGTNPTGSFKDRGMVLAVTRALERGARAVVCASTGNTAASAAAYAAAAGIPAFVLLPAGKVARGKLAQALVAGARLVMIDGNFDEALDAVRRLGEDGAAAVVNSINPDRLEGQQTAAWEICDTLGGAPDALALPVGNAGNITAYWRGFTRYAAEGRTSARPRMLGFQAEGAAPIVRGAPVAEPETVATAIRIGNPASWDLAVAARDESGGPHRGRERRGDHRRAARRGAPGGDLLRARLGGGRGRGAAPGRGRAPPSVSDGRLRAHRARPEGPRRGAGRGGHPDPRDARAGRHPPRHGPLGDAAAADQSAGERWPAITASAAEPLCG